MSSDIVQASIVETPVLDEISLSWVRSRIARRWPRMVLTIAVGIVAVISDPEAEAIDNSWILTLSYMLWGPGFFFIATVLFSPVNTKFIVPGSSVVRRGW